MKELRRIVVPLDFSEHSRRALDEATAFAKKFGAELHLMHCLEMFVPASLSFYNLGSSRSFESDARELREAAEGFLTEWSRRTHAAGVPVHPHLAVEPPFVETADLADRIGADLIVMGTRGLTGLKHALLGSVAERTVRLASCPVLTVGGGSHRPHPAVNEEKVAMKEIHKILVPVDFSDHSQRALDEAIGLAQVFGAEVHLLHSHQIHPQAIVAPYGIAVPETFEHDVRIAALKRLSEWCDKVISAGCKAQEHLTAHFPAEAITETAERVRADLIVMGTRGLTGLKHVLLGSVAERTIRTAPCPVLTVKSGAPH